MYACLLLVQESPCPVFIPSTASCAHFLRLFSWPSSCLLMVCLPFLLISLRVVCPGPSHSCTPLSDCKWTELLQRGQGSRPPSSFFSGLCISLSEHVFVETYGLNYWPSVSCFCFFPAADSLRSLAALSVGSGNPASITWP